MKIGKLRKKLRSKKFLEKMYGRLTEKAEDWHRFERFDCNSFFKGYERAQYNRRIYNREIEKVIRQIAFIKSLLSPEQ